MYNLARDKHTSLFFPTVSDEEIVIKHDFFVTDAEAKQARVVLVFAKALDKLV